MSFDRPTKQHMVQLFTSALSLNKVVLLIVVYFRLSDCSEGFNSHNNTTCTNFLLTCLVFWRLTITNFPPFLTVNTGRLPLGWIWSEVPRHTAKSACLKESQVKYCSKGSGKRLPARATFVRDTKNVPDFVQKHFVSATNVSLFAQPKKHHEQRCVLVCQGLKGYLSPFCARAAAWFLIRRNIFQSWYIWERSFSIDLWGVWK